MPDYTLDPSEELIRHNRSPVNLGSRPSAEAVAARVAELLAAFGGPKVDARHHRQLGLKLTS